MRRSAWLLALALAACTTSQKQNEAAPPKAEPKPADVRAMLATPLVGAPVAKPVAADEKDNPRTLEVTRLLTAYADEQNAWMEPYRALKTAEERQAYSREKPRPTPDATVKQLWPLVEQDAKDDAAFTALEWLVRNDREGSGRAADLLVAGFAQDERIARVVPLLARGEKGVNRVERLAKESPHRAVRGVALYEQAGALKDAEGYDEAEVVALLESVVKDYGDLPRGKRTLGDYARGDLREIQVLAVGKPAPEIAGEDIGGTPFKLSDYRGKVVMLDFWGDW